MGADVMRWQYCAQPPDRNLLFGFGPAQEIKRRLLTLWNSAKFLADYGAIESFRPSTPISTAATDAELQPLDRWLVERTAQLVEEAEGGYERWLTVDVTAPSTRSSTTSRTGTSAARAAASGTATRRRCARSGWRSCRGCA
jgi:isoleucyl-tRNA synthetase